METTAYINYLGEIEFTLVKNPNQITVSMLSGLEPKEGYAVDEKIRISVCRKFEPMKVLNQVSIFESVDQYYVIDPFGVIIYEDDAANVLEYIIGFYSDEEI